MLNFACVRMGTAYSVEYVERLRNMITKHVPRYAFNDVSATGRRPNIICLTDQPEDVEGVQMIRLTPDKLNEGWWAKMLLFNPQLRGDYSRPTIYFDLDTVIVDDLTALVDYAIASTEFAICANFTKRAGNLNYPCNYGSCVMIFPAGFGAEVYHSYLGYWQHAQEIAGAYGDQFIIEKMLPSARLLQDVMPSGYFVGRRQFDVVRPKDVRLLIFAGKVKPHNTTIEWIKEQWK